MTTSSTNYTGLYSGGVTTPIPNTAYGNANVVSLLAAGSDGGNTVGNIVATGNISTGNILTNGYYFANGVPFTIPSSYGDSNVEALLSGGTVSSNIITSANISGSYILGNGSQLTGLPQTYSNANVATFLANFGSNVIVTTGNITGGNFIGSGSALTNLPGGNVTGNVANAVHAYFADVANSVAGANVTGTVANATYAVSAGSATTAGTVTTAAQPNITSVGTLTSLSSSGNVTAAYFIGDGSQLSNINAGNIVGGYGNANVANFLANYGSNTIVTTGNITGGNINGNGSGLSSITGANVTGTVANATYATSAGTATSATTAGTVTTAAQPNITSVGTLTSVTVTGNVQGGNLRTGGVVSAAGDVTGGNLYTGGTVSAGANVNGGNINATGLVSAVGNVIGSYFIGNGSQLTGLPVAYSNAEVANFLANFGSNTINTTGNITGGNLISTANIYAGVNLDVGANLIVSGQIQATGSNINGANILASALVRGQTVSAIGNVVGGNITTTGQVSATGNITGGNIIGTIVGSVSAANIANYVYVENTVSSSNFNVLLGSVGDTYGRVYSDGGANLVFNPSSEVLSVPIISASGNITTGSTVNATNANTSGNTTAGQVFISTNNIKSTNTWDPNTTPQIARITVGTGYNGDYSTTYDPVNITRGSQFAVINKQNIGNADSNQGLRLTTSMLYADLNGGTLTNNNRRLFGGSFVNQMGNGTQNMTVNQYLGAAGGSGALLLGNIGTSTLGNLTLGHGTGQLNTVVFGTGATVGNSVAQLATTSTLSATGTVTNAIGTAVNFTTATTPSTAPTTVIGYYMPNATSTYGIASATAYRGATNYYFLKNDDDAAQSQLGSLRSYTEFNAVSGTTSGSLTIDKTAGQVQQVNLAGNVSSLAFSNFVSSASDGTNTDEQSDTVTIIFNQGSTGGYGVTFPTGSTYKYAGNVTALQSTAANSVSLVSVSAIRISSTTTYLITISPGFV